MSNAIKILSFDEAISKSKDHDKSVLLGNGFSIAWNSKIFSYQSLRDRSKNLDADTLKVFHSLDTVDFEEVINAFHYAGIVCNALDISNDFTKKSEKVRDVLIETLADSHPNHPDEITSEQFKACISFLKNFNSKIYTINYDMLLYWTLMRDLFRDDGTKPQIIKLEDGFAYNDEDFLNWDGTRFDIHFLHGALHIFEYESIQKLNYNKTQIPLKNQFIDLIKVQRKLPLFVAEGSSKKKLNRIHSSGYLTRCYNSLQKIGSAKKPNSFFTYGVSFSENDDHIIHALAKNKCTNFYIGIYGDPRSEANKKTIANIGKLKTLRQSKKYASPIEISFYDTSTANLWG